MSFKIPTAKGRFTPAPEGVHPAVPVDVVDKGQQETPWGKRAKVMLVWEIAARHKNGKPFLVRKVYTASLDQRSHLFKDLTAWLGRALSAKEAASFDLEKMIGVPCQVLIQHNTMEDGAIFPNVAAVLPAAEQKLEPSGQYVRKEDRERADL
jgi:hypothetical protein